MLDGLRRWFDRNAEPSPATPRASSWERAESLALLLLPVIVLLTVAGTTLLLVMPNVDRTARADEKLLAMGIAALFANIAVIFLARLIGGLDRGDSLGIESHWGGLGGGVGGWRISRVTVYLICTVTFAALAALALSEYVRRGPADADQSRPQDRAGSAAAKKPAVKTTTTQQANVTTTTGTTPAGTTTTAAPTTTAPTTTGTPTPNTGTAVQTDTTATQRQVENP
ncbi:MAG TPA: hypothetical protein VE010_15325 [Thermoanaerobaculia bacterium]|nr:hypothetical protein [Thermoanaerobaculia bacterium]